MPKHIGIVGCSAEGAALCYRTICSEAPALMGEHMHPEVSMHTHPFEMRVPTLGELPDHPAAVLDSLAAFAVSVRDDEPDVLVRREPPDWHARPYADYVGLLNGRTFFEVRPQLARGLFSYPEYREWVLAKLQQEARRKLDQLAEEFRRRAPELRRPLPDPGLPA